MLERNVSLGSDMDMEWLDLATLTRHVAVSERTLRGWIHRSINPLPAVRVQGKILVRRSVFNRWLESHPLVPADSLDVEATANEIIAGLRGKNGRKGSKPCR
jgi:hypothetical protein